MSDDSDINKNECVNQDIIDNIMQHKYESGSSYIQISKIASAVNMISEGKTISTDKRSIKKHATKRLNTIFIFYARNVAYFD